MVNFLQKTNNAKSTLVNTISDTDLLLEVVDISSFPSSPIFSITVWNKVVYPDPSDDPNMEILRVTDISSGNGEFTITRAAESTIAHSHSSGSAVELLFTTGQLEEIQNEFLNYIPYTGASSDVDLGSRKITAKEILVTAPITLTYNGSGQLTQVAKTGGTTKTLTYNGDGTLNTLNDGTRTKTFNWSGGVLQSVSIS
jgi:YD repeat-containing protein